MPEPTREAMTPLRALADALTLALVTTVLYALAFLLVP